MTDQQGDLDMFDQLVEDTGEGHEPGQPYVDQSPGWKPDDAVLEAGQ